MANLPSAANAGVALLPSALLVAGVYVVKPEFVAYAVAVAGVLVGFAFISNGSMSFPLFPVPECDLMVPCRASQGVEPYRVPELCAQGEERRLAQRLHLPVCSSPAD